MVKRYKRNITMFCFSGKPSFGIANRNLGDRIKRGDTITPGSMNPQRSDIPSFPISYKLIGQKARVKKEDEREGIHSHPPKQKEEPMNFVGVDISKNSFTYSIINQKGELVQQDTLPFTRKGLEKFLSVLQCFKPVSIGIESTGPYHILLTQNLKTHGYRPKIINPLLIKNFHKSTSLRKTKTDRVDSKTIAKFMKQQGENIPENSASELKNFARTREELARENAKIQCQIRQLLHSLFPEIQNINIKSKRILSFLMHFPSARKIRENERKARRQWENIFKSKGSKPLISIDRIISLARESIGIEDPIKEELLSFYIERLLSIREEIKRLSSILGKLVEERYKEEFEILCSIPGISKTLAVSFLVEIEGKNFPTWKSLIAYAGIDPSVNQSGNFTGKSRISKRGNSHLRRTLYLMSLLVIPHEPSMRAYYLKKLESLAPKQAIIATANKLVRIIHTLLERKQHFQPHLLNSHS